MSTTPDARHARVWVNELARAGRAGVIVVTSRLSGDQQRRLHEVGLPVVMVDPVNVPDPGLMSVGSSNWSGGRAATEHLLGLGHERVALLRGSPGACDDARYHGYIAALTSHGLVPDPSLVRVGDFRFDPAVEAATSLLTRVDRPTAIFAANDFEAVGAIEAARRLGLRVPQDLSVVGFDDGVVARSSSPPLTTVHQPLADMGAAAFRAVHESAEGRRPFAARLELATSLVVRDSTAPPARQRSARRRKVERIA